jgi:glycosyltransferase involved in cell wall biosynthesis
VRRPRILLLTQWFDPEPTFKGILFARELRLRGFDVEVVTGFPNYPGGRLYPGYRIRPIQRESIDGVDVTRVALYPSHSSSAIGRVVNYISFAASATAYGVLRARRPDLIYVYQPPLTSCIAAAVVGLVRRVPVVQDIQDLWPDTLRATGMVRSTRLLAVVAWVCNWVYRRMDRIVVLSHGFKRLLVERGVPTDKIDVIHNWADEAALCAVRTSAPAGFPVPGSFRVLFAGNMGKAQALDAAIGAARLLRERGVNARLVFMGGGVEVARLRSLARDQALDNVDFLPAVPMAEVGAYLNAADALLVHLRKDPLFRITVPSKTQAYMAVGKPIIMGVEGDASDLVERSGGGVFAEPENPESIAAAIARLATAPAQDLAMIGRRSRDFYEQELSVRAGVDRFAQLFRDLIQPNGGQSA